MSFKFFVQSPCHLLINLQAGNFTRQCFDKYASSCCKFSLFEKNRLRREKKKRNLSRFIAVSYPEFINVEFSPHISINFFSQKRG